MLFLLYCGIWDKTAATPSLPCSLGNFAFLPISPFLTRVTFAWYLFFLYTRSGWIISSNVTIFLELGTTYLDRALLILRTSKFSQSSNTLHILQCIIKRLLCLWRLFTRLQSQCASTCVYMLFLRIAALLGEFLVVNKIQ